MDLIFDGRPSESPFVEMVWRTQSEREESFTSHAVSHWEMVITKYQGQTTLTVRGPETKAVTAHCPADAEFFGIQFKLGTFMPHLPVSSLVNRQEHFPEAAGKSFWLHGAAWEFPTYDNADTFVNRMMREGLLVKEPIIEDVLQGHSSDLSTRSVQYRFLRATGLTHNAVRQIQRARYAASLLEQGTPILDTVYEAGYFDQAHMSKSIKRLIGRTPAQIAYAIWPLDQPV